MKTLLIIASLFTMITAHAAVSAKSLLGIESRIEIQRESLQEKLRSFETDDYMEGKIVASMVSMIEEKLTSAENSLNAIVSDESLTEENVAQINSILDESEKLIEEI